MRGRKLLRRIRKYLQWLGLLLRPPQPGMRRRDVPLDRPFPGPGGGDNLACRAKAAGYSKSEIVAALDTHFEPGRGGDRRADAAGARRTIPEETTDERATAGIQRIGQRAGCSGSIKHRGYVIVRRQQLGDEWQ